MTSNAITPVRCHLYDFNLLSIYFDCTITTLTRVASAHASSATSNDLISDSLLSANCYHCAIFFDLNQDVLAIYEHD